MASAQPAKMNCAEPKTTPKKSASKNGMKFIPRLAAMKGIIFDNSPEILAMMSVIAPLFLMSFAALVLLVEA